MPGLVISGEEVQVPGLEIVNFHDEPVLALRMGQDKRLRHTRWVRAIGLHTTKGLWPQTVLPGLGPFMNVGEKVAKYWTTSSAPAGAHIVVDWDGTITCHCDLTTEASMHGGVMNETTIGIEIFQGPAPEGKLYDGQLDATVCLIDALTAIYGIQRQIPRPTWDYGLVSRMASTQALKSIVGIIGHRNVTTDRGRGDPGDHIFVKLRDAGYEMWNYHSREDLEVWRGRQISLCMASDDCDGVPGPHTIDMLVQAGHEHGMWVKRP